MQYSWKWLGAVGLLALNINTLNAQSKSDSTPIITLSLPQVLAKATAYSKVIKIADLKVTVSEKDVRDASAAILPEISVRGNLERATNMAMYEDGLLQSPTQRDIINTRYKIGGEAYFNLYNGNKTNLKIAAENTRQQMTREQRNLTASEIKLRAVARYLDIQQSSIFRDLLIKDIADQEKQVAQIKDFQQNGLVLNSDVLRAELKLSRQKMSLIQLENDIVIASQKLNILIGEAENFRVNPIEDTDPGSVPLNTHEDYIAAAISHSYLTKISAQEVALSKIKVKEVKGNLAPKTGLYAEYNYAYPQISLYPYAAAPYGLGVIGVKAAFPVSGFYHNKNKVQAAQLVSEQQIMAHANLEENIRQQVNEAWLRYKEGLQRIDIAVANVAQATENFRIVNNTYFNQTSLITDLLDADVQLLQTKFELASSQIAARLQYYKLQYIIGEL
jgi:outer membrane protein TolC